MMGSTEKYVLLNPAFLSGDNSLCVEFPDRSVVKYVPERTCEVVEKQAEWQFNFGVKDYELSCGHMVGWAHTYEPKYCPNCGARVKEESCER